MKSYYLLKLTLYGVSFSTVLLNVVERVYAFVFNKPIFVHVYFRKKKLSKQKKEFLETSITFYQNLDDKHKAYFEHRVAKFIREYQFISRNSFEFTPEKKVLIAASYIKLTFGMRKYLTQTFDKIIVYPEVYYSLITEQYHKGEYNPALKIIIFSWEDFLIGNIITNDNINLGIHEFSHALTFHGSKSKDVSARIFYRKYKEILDYVSNEGRLKQIQESNYFREYAMTNKIEFVAVIMEHFFESPIELQQQFPKLYAKIEKMLNYRSILNQQWSQ
ncbi:zinc-dependent peptidase [Tenacibaculum agarivorans]|uniref:zinc-dependent peptidase n=1 Tax=Tenacibaculum agarivorans TaxID=1908389 RepID=UPI00094BA6F2|nr:zinc-dependent peptidase [Tenacibaculum agarivorans]